MENVISDWNLLKTDAELEIIKKHSNFGRLYTLLFTREINILYYICIIQCYSIILILVSHQSEIFSRWIYLFY